MEEIFNSMSVLDASTGIWKVLLRIGISIIAGFLIGLESKSRSKDAGMKTHTIICLTSCLLMIVSKYGFYELSKFDGISYDTSRIAANIISGLCFLGAGVLVYKKDIIFGLTTAVSICLTIAIGMCIGSGLLITGCVVTIITIILQKLLHLNKGVFKSPKSITVTAKFKLDDDYIEHFKQVFEVRHFNRFKIFKENDIEVAEVEFLYKVKVSSEELFLKVKNEPQIISLEKEENK